ncbi:MAG: hypothetical protein GQE15_26975 [Archangiaceae bacterium]|nr:hypothetical protein [Archangiaceae bacterium]
MSSFLEDARAALDDAPKLATVLARPEATSEIFFDLLPELKSGERWPRLLAVAGPNLKRVLERWTPRTSLGRPRTCEAFCQVATGFLRERFPEVPTISSNGLELETLGFCAQGGRLRFDDAMWRIELFVEMAEVGPAEVIHEETWTIHATDATARFVFICDASDPTRTAAWVQSLPLDAHPLTFNDLRRR